MENEGSMKKIVYLCNLYVRTYAYVCARTRILYVHINCLNCA